MTESRASLMRGFSHDVKNSLNTAHLYSELLEKARSDCVLTQRQQQMIERIRQSLRTSVRLIDDVLELARAETGQLRLERVKTDIGEVARELADEFRVQASAAGLALEVRSPEGLRAETDPARLRQIVTNLLSNAVKYASPGPVTLRSELRHSGGPRPGQWIAISVTDRGPGIPEDKTETIFEEYTRLNPSASQGAGIGLAISRRIARLLGGDLRVSTEVGGGSTFTLWIPVTAAADVDAAGHVESAPQWDA